MVVKVAVIGASGYTGGELLRLLALHPKVEVSVVTSREYAGKPVYFVHFNLRTFFKNLRFSSVNIDQITSLADVVFLALPHGVSLNYVPKFLEVGIKVIDLSADFRLKNPDDYRKWYGYEHPYPDLLKKSVYGMPELHRNELRNAELIAVPGCNATAVILALIPLVKNNVIELDKIIADVKVGSSEGGAKPVRGSHHPEREGCIRPYDAEGHRHTAEVVQELRPLVQQNEELNLSLIPHAVSSVRGVLASVHTWARNDIGPISLLKMYMNEYKNEPFVRVVRNVPPGYPDPKYVIGSNFADIGFAFEKPVKRITSFCAIDNLVKGAAGQAIQSFNIMMKFNEDLGLIIPPLKPV